MLEHPLDLIAENSYGISRKTGETDEELLHRALDALYAKMGIFLDTASGEDLDRAVGLVDPVSVGFTGPSPVDLSRFPHTCPRCGGPAYIGLASVDCADGGCK